MAPIFMTLTFKRSNDLIVHTNGDTESLQKIQKVAEANSFKQIKLEDGSFEVKSDFQSTTFHFDPNRKYPERLHKMSCLAGLLSGLSIHGWSLKDHILLSSEVKTGTLLLEQNNEAPPYRRKFFGCSVDTAEDRYFLFPKDVNLQSTFADLTEDEAVLLQPDTKDAQKTGPFTTIDLPGHCAMKVFSMAMLETKNVRIMSYLNMLEVLERRGFKVYTIMSSCVTSSDSIIFSSENPTMTNDPNSQLWALSLNRITMSDVWSQSSSGDQPPNHMFGLNTFNAPPKAKATMLKTFCHASANDNFNNIMSYMCWKAKDKNSKLGMIRIMRSLQKMGWHVQWTLNWGFSHSVLIFKKGRCLETSMMHLSVASLKKMFMQVVPKREEELVATSLLQSKLMMNTLETLAPFGAKMKRGEELIRLPENTFRVDPTGGTNGIFVLLKVLQLLRESGWTFCSVVDVSGLTVKHENSIHCSSFFLTKNVTTLDGPPESEVSVHVYRQSTSNQEEGEAVEVTDKDEEPRPRHPPSYHEATGS